MTTKIILAFFKNGKKVAEEDITRYSVDELKLLLQIQEDMNRTWEYKYLIKEGK